MLAFLGTSTPSYRNDVTTALGADIPFVDQSWCGEWVIELQSSQIVTYDRLAKGLVHIHVRDARRLVFKVDGLDIR